MGLLTPIQIPRHRVLANWISLNLKYHIGIKQIFNINLGIGIIKKLLFLFVFSTYLLVFLLKFQSGELTGCEIKFRIQRVPTRHTFDGPRYPKNKKYLKNVMMTSSSYICVTGGIFSCRNSARSRHEWGGASKENHRTS